MDSRPDLNTPVHGARDHIARLQWTGCSGPAAVDRLLWTG
jgi:hypothetical protein